MSEELERLKAAIPTVVNYEGLMGVAHDIAVNKGWWKDGLMERDSEEVFANFHAEVSEAWEEYRNGRMDVWYAEGSDKPEGFWVEIADLMIRMADCDRACTILRMPILSGDYVAGLSTKLLLRERKDRNFVPTLINILHEDLIGTGWVPRMTCEYAAELMKVDLYAIIRSKMTYNLTRPYRHGGKQA